MKRLIRNTLCAMALSLPSAALAADGPEVFKAQNCDSCHSVKSAGIARVDNPDKKAKDLSDIGSRYDKKFLAGYLLKKNAIDDEKHQKTFGGTTEDLKTLATWLESLKK